MPKVESHKGSTRKYEVTGTDNLGDVHTFASDDRERAEEVAEVKRHDLPSVIMIENG